MVHVAPGSWPPSWSQNEVKVLIDAEPSLYSSSVETPGPGEKIFSDPGLALPSAGLARASAVSLYLFGTLPSDYIPLCVCLQPLCLHA